MEPRKDCDALATCFLKTYPECQSRRILCYNSFCHLTFLVEHRL
jgi:hypothetical protein